MMFWRGYAPRVSTLRHGRVAENEAFFRDVNEHALERRDQFLRRLPPDEPVRFMCECASGECEQTLQLTLAEYSHVRDHPDWFIVIPVTKLRTSRTPSSGAAGSTPSRSTQTPASSRSSGRWRTWGACHCLTESARTVRQPGERPRVCP